MNGIHSVVTPNGHAQPQYLASQTSDVKIFQLYGKKNENEKMLAYTFEIV